MTKEELIRILNKQKMYEIDERGRLIEYLKDSTNPSRIYIDLFNLVMDLGDISIDELTAQSDLIAKIQNGIKASTDEKDAYLCGLRNGMRWCRSLLDDEEPNYEDPSRFAQPEREKGHWIIGEIETGAFNVQYQWKRCSKCGWESSLVIPRNFCPKCGADMKGGEQDDSISD